MDLINGAFEICGGLFILLSIRQLHLVKRVAGVSFIHVAFFTFWGLWNLLYYPALGQWVSFAGGVSVVLANAFWLGQIVYYGREA